MNTNGAHLIGFKIEAAAGTSGLTPIEEALLNDAANTFDFDPATGIMTVTDGEGDETPIDLSGLEVGAVDNSTYDEATGELTLNNADGTQVIVDLESDAVTEPVAQGFWDAL